MLGDNERSRLFTRRAVLVGAMQTGLFAVLAGRVYYLEIVEGEKFRTLAEENRINLRLIAPRRGQILDRFGTPLAVNQQSFRVVLLPEQVKDLNGLLDRLGGFVELSESDRKRIARDIRNADNFNAVLVKSNLTRDQIDALALHSLDLPGAEIDVDEVRAYPYGAATSHVLGYIGVVSAKEKKDIDDDGNSVLAIPGFRVGKNGIEKQRDLDLRGEAGHVQMEVNARGSVVRELARHDASSGKDIALGLDIGLQQYAQQRLAREESAAVVVMDIKTGEVRIMVSQPGFDPNLFTYGISQEDWDELNNDEHTPLMNKAISGSYAPGSTIKPIVALAGLDADMLNPANKVFCPGYYEIGTYRFHCWKRGGHGHVNMREAIAESCDTYFYELGHRIGVDRIQAMAKRFGLGQKLGIDMPHERPGLLPTKTWKLASQGQAWQQGETLVAAIGQGYMLATPLQLAVMTARIASGGLAVEPRMAAARASSNSEPSQPSPWSSLGLDRRHVELVQEALFAVVNEPGGTAYGSRILEEGMEMVGKTGTSQVRRISDSEREDGVLSNDALPWKERDHALFVGYAPDEDPRYAISVIVEHGGSGGHNAAPIAHDILKECLERDKAREKK
ncbi:MAG: penicillin-binding protein 2 [Bdellovibrionales bacterium]